MNEADIRNFWQANPCGDHQVGGLDSGFARDYEQFFDEYDKFRYTKEAHILDCLQQLDVAGKDLLEIGLGQGADSEQLIRLGAHWSGLDLTAEAVARLRMRLQIRGLPFANLKQGSALDIPYSDNSFDMVFSHGVLHHIPDIRKAQSEIARVLRPGGELVAMLYAKWSLNYVLSIALLRRLGLLGMYVTNRSPGGIYKDHLENARKSGLFNYLKMSNFIHRNTDGPGNPYSKVYDVATVRADFADFEVVRSYKRWLYAPPLPVKGLPGGRALGWHLWVHLRPRKRA